METNKHFGGNRGGLGRDIGHGDYTPWDDTPASELGFGTPIGRLPGGESKSQKRIMEAFGWNILGATTLAVAAAAPGVPRVIRALAAGASATTAANAYLIFRDEINRPSSR